MNTQEAVSQQKISVITIVNNQADYLRDNIKSVLAQDYQEVEHIVVDSSSMDITSEVVSEYNHLKYLAAPGFNWIKSLALGLSRSSGEYIGWLSGNDYYSPRIFSEVVEKLEDKKIVHGQVQIVGESKQVLEINSNLARSWYDIWKYWIYNAIPANQGIFIHRAELERIVSTYNDSNYQGLDFAFDYIFWLEIVEQIDFNNYVPKVYGNTRDTGSTRDKAYFREASRLFRRSANSKALAERQVSLVIMADDLNDEFEKTLQSCSCQSLADVEVVTCCLGDSEAASRLSAFISGVAEAASDGRYRFFKSNESLTPTDILNELAGYLRSPVTVLLYAGQVLRSEGALEVSNYFEQDSLAAIVFTSGRQDLYSQLTLQHEGNELFNVQYLFSGQPLPASYAIRTGAILELGELYNNTKESWPVFHRILLLLLQYKGWSVQVISDGVVDSLPESAISNNNFEDISVEVLQALLIHAVSFAKDKDPFAVERSQHGQIIEFPSETVIAAQDFLKSKDLL